MGGVPFPLCFSSFKFSNENRLLYVQESLLNSGTSVWLLPPNINLIDPSLCNVNKAEQPSGSTINCSPGRELIFIEWFQCAQPWRDPGIVSGGGSAWTVEEKYCQVRTWDTEWGGSCQCHWIKETALRHLGASSLPLVDSDSCPLPLWAALLPVRIPFWVWMNGRDINDFVPICF